MKDASANILILGLGNSFMGDDGVGPAVIDILRRRGLPGSVRAEVAPDVLALPDLWQEEVRVWLVDALVRGDSPGTVHRLSHDAILALGQRHASAHHLSLPEGLRWIVHTHPRMAEVRYRLWGVEPYAVAPGAELSPIVSRAAGSVARELRRRSAERRRRN
jgi:hydrogenase maturation protease